jgi:hypothetical protein
MLLKPLSVGSLFSTGNPILRDEEYERSVEADETNIVDEMQIRPRHVSMMNDTVGLVRECVGRG